MRSKVRYVARRIRLTPRWTRVKFFGALRRASTVRKLAKKEFDWDAPSWRMRRPTWWLRGYLSRSVTLYDFENRSRELYLSDYQRIQKTRRMVHPRLQDVINNKFTTHLLLGTMDIRSAQLLGVYWRGAVHRFPGEGRVPLRDYLTSIPLGGRVFFKIMAGAEGRNIASVTRLDDVQWRVHGVDHDLEGALKALDEKRPMIVEEALTQHPKQAALFPDAVNTLRVLTVLDVNDNHQPFIAMAVQRIGSRRSAPVDNWTQGGLSARVDLDTGELSRASRLPPADELEWFDHHPDTGAPIHGVQVPYWAEIRDMVLHAARVLSFMEYIGWDIVITPDGPVVLEANINTGLNVLQVHQPLLADPRVRAYFAERGVTDLPPDEPPPVTGNEPI